MPDSDVQIYVNSMARIRERINFIQAVNVNQINIPSTGFKGEFMFLQFRKVLEEIAFSSLAANKDKYTEVYTDFATHWNAKKILKKTCPTQCELLPGWTERACRAHTRPKALRARSGWLHDARRVR
jgi:hypothetical protein